ncbi:hypothetical protein BT67DRAFT_125344 [Trichocladium antarcticum]|uniref:Uncharacterized protein n=1 Tax=Trichocladium antarcticum TaxID=1450529 RepID=A0AAN6USK4_9PEZI|nr:hypothetical protein BT67DRAFT_125344 [Trichocladium antarcticum]
MWRVTCIRWPRRWVTDKKTKWTHKEGNSIQGTGRNHRNRLQPPSQAGFPMRRRRLERVRPRELRELTHAPRRARQSRGSIPRVSPQRWVPAGMRLKGPLPGRGSAGEPCCCLDLDLRPDAGPQPPPPHRVKPTAPPAQTRRNDRRHGGPSSTRLPGVDCCNARIRTQLQRSELWPLRFALRRPPPLHTCPLEFTHCARNARRQP